MLLHSYKIMRGRLREKFIEENKEFFESNTCFITYRSGCKSPKLYHLNFHAKNIRFVKCQIF